MHGPGDVRFFDRTTRLYDLVMPSTDPEPIREAFSLADRPIERLLDLGGGTGRASLALDGPSDPDDRLVADISRGMLGRARDAGLRTVECDARRLPFRNGSWDAVVVVDALHHMPDPGVVYREVERVLAPGGVFVVRDFDPSSVRGWALALGERVVGFGSRFATPDALAEEISTAGFETRVLDRGFTFTVAGRKRGSQEG